MTETMAVKIEDLGVQAKGALWMRWIHGRHPTTGAELAIGALAAGGFVVVDPAARTALVVRPEITAETGWAIGQAPDGKIYQAGVHTGRKRAPLLCWDWVGDEARVVADRTFRSVFSLDVAPDGGVYMPEYGGNAMYRYDPRTARIDKLGTYAAFGAHVRNVICAADGWVYATCTDFKSSCLVGIDPSTGAMTNIDLVPPGYEGWTADPAGLCKDACGHALIALNRWGRCCWIELVGGTACWIDQKDIALVRSEQGAYWPLAFRDGSAIVAIKGTTVSYVNPDGQTVDFEIEWLRSPLRIFSIDFAADRIWGGTFIPLTLFAHDPDTGECREFGNPTETDGEIYSMAYAERKLFLGSYYKACLTRFAPEQPWCRDGSPQANPKHLGLMKDPPLPLMRPYGAAQSSDGMVYFSACGGYGCTDAGLARIDPRSETVTRWLYPETTFGAMIYLAPLDRLAVVERRLHENALRLSFLSPQTGAIAHSIKLIEDSGTISSLLYDGGDWIYGLHDYRATIFAFSLKEDRMVRKLPELGLGGHCHRCLVFGPDDRIWGLTVECVFSVDRALTNKTVVSAYDDHADGNGYRFGFVRAPDGCFYFPNGPHLMRVRTRPVGSL